MIVSQLKKLLPYAHTIILVLSVIVLVLYIKHKSNIDDETNALSFSALNSARDTIKVLTNNNDSMQLIIKHTLSQVDTFWKIRKIYVDSSSKHESAADAIIKQADSIAILAPADSTRVCKLIKQAYVERTTECEQLKKTVILDSSTIKLMTDSVTKINLGLLKSDSIIKSTNKLIDSVKSIRSCKILFIPCPSRKLSTALGAVGGAVIVFIIHH